MHITFSTAHYTCMLSFGVKIFLLAGNYFKANYYDKYLTNGKNADYNSSTSKDCTHFGIGNGRAESNHTDLLLNL